MNTDNLLREIEDALVSASKYADAHHGLIMMTHARARTLIQQIRAARSQGKKPSVEREEPLYIIGNSWSR